VRVAWYNVVGRGLVTAMLFREISHHAELL